MGKPADTIEVTDDLRTRIAWLYHMEGLTQDDIARILGLNRSRVLRILSSARSSGIVEVNVTSPLSNCVRLERSLERRFRLEQAIVVPRPQNARDTSALLGSVLGAFITANLREGLKIGLGWGRTLSASLPSIPQQSVAGVSVTSMLGGLTRVSGANPSEFAWRLADRLSAECYLMAAPVFAPDPRTREALLSHPGIQEVFTRARQLDMAIISAGELSPFSTITDYLLLEPDEIGALEQQGVVGDVLCRFIDIDGHVLDHPLNRRVVAVDPLDLHAARQRVLVSGGWQKYAVIRGAMKLLRPHVLITDELVAERLAEEP